MTFALHGKAAAVVSVALLGAAGFATVAPLQMWVLERANGVGQSLASSFNIAAFNLGNAIGAWAGGAVIDHGPGLAWVPLVAALFPLAALGVADGRLPPRPPCACLDLTDKRQELKSWNIANSAASGLKVPALSFGAGTFGGSGPLFGAWGSTRCGGGAAAGRHLPRGRRQPVRHRRCLFERRVRGGAGRRRSRDGATRS